jgi:hypothetical protein
MSGYGNLIGTGGLKRYLTEKFRRRQTQIGDHRENIILLMDNGSARKAGKGKP